MGFNFGGDAVHFVLYFAAAVAAAAAAAAIFVLLWGRATAFAFSKRSTYRLIQNCRASRLRWTLS